MGGAFPFRLGIERRLQPAGPPPPEAVGVSLEISACVSIVFVTFVYVGPVSRPAVVAETRLRLNIFSPVVTVAVFPCVLERVVVGAVEVDPYCTALTPGHQIS